MYRKEKGITLIALIITIIVMLILVAVTVAFAMNGGLFEKAKKGSADYERNAIGETILGSYVLDETGTLNIKLTAKNAKDTLKTQEYKDEDIKITYSDGTYANDNLSGKILASNDNNLLIASNTGVDADWAVIQVNAKTGVYYYELTKKPSTRELTKEEDEEGNTILTGGENTYNITDDVITIADGPTPPETPWYILTAEEKAQLLPRHMQPVEEGHDPFTLEFEVTTQEQAEEMGYPVGTEVFMIASDLSTSIMYMVSINDLGNGESVKLYQVMNQVGNIIYMSMSDEDYQKAIDAGFAEQMPPLNTWIDHGEVATECPEDFMKFATTETQYCYCPSYLERIIASFDSE